MLFADFGFAAGFDPKARLFNPELGGGALLDVGVYTLSLSSMLFGPPGRITSTAHLGQTGVDEQSAFILSGEAGQLSVLSCAVSTSTPQDAVIMGDKGQIRIHPPWWRTTGLTLSVPGGDDETFEVPYDGNGYNCQAAEVMTCLREGKTESDVMPLDETLSIMKTADAIRAQWGLKYPME